MAEPAQYIQPTAYDAEGKPVAPEAAPQLVADGKAGYQKGARVWVRGDTGQLGTVDASEAHAQPVLSQTQLEQLLLKRDAESRSLLDLVIRLEVVESMKFSATFEPTRSGTVPALSKYEDGLMTKPTLCLGEMRLSGFTSHSSGITPTSVFL